MIVIASNKRKVDVAPLNQICLKHLYHHDMEVVLLATERLSLLPVKDVVEQCKAHCEIRDILRRKGFRVIDSLVSRIP